MPMRAKLYFNSTIITGAALLAGCLMYGREFSQPNMYLAYLLLACLGSTLKIRLPRMKGTMSVNFLFILIGVAELTLVETIALGGLGALIQSFWKPKTRPAPIQVLFNIGALITSIGVSFAIAHVVVPQASLPARLSMAVGAYFLANTGMVSMVLSLVEGRPFANVWRQCCRWSLPYYAVGALIACAVLLSSRVVGWQLSLTILPVMYLVYSLYRLYVANESAEQSA